MPHCATPSNARRRNASCLLTRTKHTPFVRRTLPIGSARRDARHSATYRPPVGPYAQQWQQDAAAAPPPMRNANVGHGQSSLCTCYRCTSLIVIARHSTSFVHANRRCSSWRCRHVLLRLPTSTRGGRQRQALAQCRQRRKAHHVPHFSLLASRRGMQREEPQLTEYRHDIQSFDESRVGLSGLGGWTPL